MRRSGRALVAVAVVAATACSGSDDAAPASDVVEESTPTVAAGEDSRPATEAAGGGAGPFEVVEDADLVYLRDDFDEWTLRVFSPDAPGPWPLVVVFGWTANISHVGEEIAQRGAVAVVAESWARPEASTSDPSLLLYGELDRAACAVGWAQAHASDYGAEAAATTVTGYSGGAPPAAWVGLGLADDSACPDEVVRPPVAMALGEIQFIFHHERWDPAFESGDPEPAQTVDGLINPVNWEISPDLRVGLWSAADPVGEIRPIANPPGDDSWIWSRDRASPFMDDFVAVGALDDNRVDWSDNADLMERRMERAGVDVRNEVYPIGHVYADPVYELLFAIQP